MFGFRILRWDEGGPRPPLPRNTTLKTVLTKLYVSCLGERLNDNELDSVLTDCMDPEDDEGFIPYIREYPFSSFKSILFFSFFKVNVFIPI